jgi:hypothetical protein
MNVVHHRQNPLEERDLVDMLISAIVCSQQNSHGSISLCVTAQNSYTKILNV